MVGAVIVPVVIVGVRARVVPTAGADLEHRTIVQLLLGVGVVGSGVVHVWRQVIPVPCGRPVRCTTGGRVGVLLVRRATVPPWRVHRAGSVARHRW